jgi:hypothetical protein
VPDVWNGFGAAEARDVHGEAAEKLDTLASE